MIICVSIVLLLGVRVWFLVHITALRAWQALLCILFGFYLAASPLAPYVSSAATAVARLISGITL